MILGVAEAARRLRDGELVAYPTETVYGLGADATRADGVERLRTVKGSDDERGFSVLVADAAALERWADSLAEEARELAGRFWPGPLTLVVPAAAELSAVATPLGVGFRCSPHPTAAALAREVARPVVSSSCNRAGEPPCHTAEEVARVFGEDLPIAGGEPAGGLSPSTVVAVASDGSLELLREGSLPFSVVARGAA